MLASLNDRKRPNLPPLTSLRFFAASGVVIFHYNLTNPIFPKLIASFGYEAVTFFFVLSGFILAYAHGIPHGKLNVTPKDFLLARFARIWPVYDLALAMVILLFFVVDILKPGLALPAVLVISMVQSWVPRYALALNPPAWSLSNEIFFYLLFPAIWGATRLGAVSFLVLSATFVVSIALLKGYCFEGHEAGRTNFWMYFPILNFPQFVFGVALGYYFIVPNLFGPKISTGLLVIGVTLLSVVMLLKTTLPWISNGAVLCGVFSLIIFGAAGAGGMAQKILCARPLVILGDASYAIYILHFPVWLWWNHYTRIAYRLDLPSTLDAAIYLFVVMIVSLASLFFLERPARRALRRGRIAAQESGTASFEDTRGRS
jgi:peptidoglycan/LPS O-acetylase OafA/YrhL